MARYFYDRLIGLNLTLDEGGMVCRDDKAAVRNGWLCLTGMLVTHEEMQSRQDFEIVVRREDGVHVGRLGMTVVVDTKNLLAAEKPPLIDGNSARRPPSQ